MTELVINSILNPGLNSSPDIIRRLIWKTAYMDKRHYLESYYMIMEYLCREYDAECVESLSKEDYDSFIENLNNGHWRS